ncbi:hypothetical protein ACRZ5S_14585 [Vibrio scophthalmi]|uniref:Uncharacterized protein n=1 Tax=Vibrio scophthalmi TaxID=45658 RepID=A0A1E3WM76_9VIBR|nr:hypothetical protein [Vibrio scophthalmi]ODS09818.1 hypothetical protein VSF3289_00049 [Vibrio scophthalmi]ODS10092.1 hypothetical protein VSF3289_00330 [Vibrio scophthalmi]
MAIMFAPLLFAGAAGAVTGAWWTKETVEAVTGGESGRPPYLLIAIVAVGLFVAWRKGWLK